LLRETAVLHVAWAVGILLGGLQGLLWRVAVLHVAWVVGT
jgi:hypothetical protein